MIGRYFFLAAIFLTMASADSSIVSFYKEALKTLSYQNIYTLQQKNDAISILMQALYTVRPMQSF